MIPLVVTSMEDHLMQANGAGSVMELSGSSNKSNLNAWSVRGLEDRHCKPRPQCSWPANRIPYISGTAQQKTSRRISSRPANSHGMLSITTSEP